MAERRAQDLWRERRVLDGPQTVEAIVDGRHCLSFCSNDYLGLASDARVTAALRDGAALYGVGSGASHLVNGHSRAHAELEEALAAWTGRERALLFSTGYMANLGVISALAARGDHIYADRLDHASLLDGALLSGARLRRYRHRDHAQLAEWLERTPATGERFIISDGVFSMDGDLAPLPELTALAAQHDACLIIDDAHGLGVIGPSGGGTIAHFACEQKDVPVLIGTLGKAFGTFGAFVAGESDLIETLIQFARSYIYTTALPPAVAHATLTALKIAREETWRRDHLAALIARFRTGARELDLSLLDLPADNPATPIIALLTGNAERALKLSKNLLERGLLVPAIRPPTVEQGSARLRITLSAAHSEAQVDRLLNALAELC
ncbi:MAG: 8-amino-7-oxononanoate synthase [Chromatiales bacterium]|nr:8-amino-7-oxononanoate synthase [Chromatiales bacterium]